MESNIKGLVAAGHEMASELKAECGAVDMRSVAKLLSDLATQLEVQLARANALAEGQQKAIESIKQADSAVKLAHEKFSALAAENAGLKAAHPQPFGHEMMKALDAYEKHQDKVPETGMLNAFFILRDSIRVDTPATDAFLAEVRAKAFDDLCAAFVKHASVSGLDDGDCVTVKEATDALLHCAEQLHKGVHS
ncbi:hypothetical protein MN359_001520 [Escherichia coli]|uniref:hypothetical protein n=1 Tax=Escherichia coli TaxID=562 RepID=UPI000B7CB3D3|nr:hypothetical protein [Escherichia coli]EEW8138415.1 hypothetical protein [Escherichia coli]EFA4412293.1 hypothetical protein [Escherichia coli]EFA4421714.1 hypothetical protein [Escherichia coli]EFB2933436.1 hypothetical protein [Escherichia coli]EFM1787338.1 hypothetical protein [Escherichia coli]